jgi:hypothetical protein
MNKKNFPPHIVDDGASYQKKVEEAPYHPGYEDAVVTPAPKYTGMNPDKMLWKPKPLTYAKLGELAEKAEAQSLFEVRIKPDGGVSLDPMLVVFARLIEEEHGIK